MQPYTMSNQDKPECTWTRCKEDYLVSRVYWETACGEIFEFNNGSPQENSFRFCSYCGKAIKEDQ